MSATRRPRDGDLAAGGRLRMKSKRGPDVKLEITDGGASSPSKS